ncbi:hypothetical protein EBT23_06145, partial [bacterium]|nr:hypothetical protein [bacterium]
RALANYRKGNLLILLATAVVIFVSAKSLRAQTNAYWDVNGTTSGQGGTGTWSTTGVYWTTNSANATANSGGPTGGGLFAVTNANPGATLTNSGNYIFNFGGTAGTVTQGGAFQAVGVNFLTSGYVWNIDGTGANNRTITTTNGVSLGANSVTLANGARGLNSFTFTGPTAAAAVGITGNNGSTLTLRNLVADSATNSFGVFLSGGTISGNISINVDIGAGSKISFGSQSTTGMTNFAAITLNTNASGVALNITNSASGIVSMNGVISGSRGLVLDNTGSGKIQLAAANTYSGGTTLNNSGTGMITISNAAAFGTGTITSAGAVTNYVRAEVSNLDIANNWQIDNGSTLRLNANNSGWNVTASGVIAGAGSMYFSNSGVNYRLTGTNNSFGGGVVVGNGTLYFSSLGMAGSNSSLGTNGVLQTGASTTAAGFRWIGSSSETSDKSISLNSTTGALNLTADSATAEASLTINGAINSTAAGNKTINLTANNSNTLSLGGIINEFSGSANAIVVASSSVGTVVLGNAANSFSGGLTINGGATSTNIVQVAQIGNVGANSALGKNSTINIGGSSATGINVLKYTGNGETSDKTINLAGTSGGATLDQSGAGNLKFTTAMTGTGVGAKALSLQGSTAGTGELAFGISDFGANAISLVKNGSGTWTLSGANNSYSGTTTVNGGTLAITGVNSGSGTVTVSGSSSVLRLSSTNALLNGVLVGASSSTNTGAVELASAGNYSIASYGTSGTGGGYLNFTNSSGGVSTLTFTGATNVVTTGGNGGRAIGNLSTNLTLIFNGAVDIGSTFNSGVTFNAVGDITINGAVINNSSGVRSLSKDGA